MIHELEIVGFKRFVHQKFAIAPLTVLCGLNGTGKTSLIHALLLAREASVKDARVVRLNGPFGLELGTAEDVQNWGSAAGIELVMHDDAGSHRWKFGIPSSDSLHLDVLARPEAPPEAFSEKPRAFTYLSAERLGPRAVFGSSAMPFDEVEVGERGQYCAQLIEALGGRPLAEADRSHPDAEPSASNLLKYEVERWLSEIARPTEIEPGRFAGTTVTTLRYRTPGGEWVRAPNMGFGVTYSLPVVLAGLIARKGGLIVVENPEAHLHPAGQSRIGVFLAWLASKGVQVVVETHSDHVLNGLRRAIGEKTVLRAQDAIVHYFGGAENDAAQATALRFSSTGGVSAWPGGFFDQYQLDVAALTSVRRRPR